jgi:hypothetical protein
MTIRMIYCLAVVLAVAIAPTGLRAQGSPGTKCTGTACSMSIGGMFGYQMHGGTVYGPNGPRTVQPNQPNLQNRSGTTKTAPSGTIQTQSRNVK